MDVPVLRGHVNDLAGLIDANARATLENRLARYAMTRGPQIVVLILPSLDGDSIEDFANRTFSAWKLGERGRDDGLLLLVALSPPASRLEVGYGLEGQVTDVAAHLILKDVLGPAFRAGQYKLGLDQTLTAVMTQIGGADSVAGADAISRSERLRYERFGEADIPSWLIVMIVMLCGLAASKAVGRRGGRLGDGGSDGGYGGYGGYDDQNTFDGGGGHSGGGGASGSW